MLRSLSRRATAPTTWATSRWPPPPTRTSPRPSAAIPTCMVHRLLRAVLTASPRPARTTSPIADECSQSERRAADAERELVEWKKVKFMAERVGEDFDALIISTTRYGLFVELADLFIEGLVPIDTLPGRPVHLPGERPQDRGQAHAPRVLHRRPGARDSGPRGRQRTQAAVLPARRWPQTISWAKMTAAMNSVPLDAKMCTVSTQYGNR